MVSGFLTSPLDQDRMASGEATPIATYSTWLTFSRPSNSRALSFELIIRSQNALMDYWNIGAARPRLGPEWVRQAGPPDWSNPPSHQVPATAFLSRAR